VTTRLRTDPDAGPGYTGYAWTSGSGPKDTKITAGTTAQVRVTIEKKAPITLVLPFLKSTSGL
jgi:HlyD family secretion protein